ncbi:MAG: hypothetical protein WCH83_18470, partial [Alphaproteobacteria bacterium]
MAVKLLVLALSAASALSGAHAQTAPVAETLFRNVRVYSGTGDSLSAPTNLLVRGNVIASIGSAKAPPGASVIDGGGRIVMPGLINAHIHMTFSVWSLIAATDT